MRDDVDAQASLNKQLLASRASIVQGVCMSIDWPSGLASVNVAGATVALPMAGIPPVINDPCWVLYAGSQAVVMCVPRSPFATTTAAASGGLVAVIGDDGVADVVAADGQTPTTGTRVVVDWSGGGVLLDPLSADPNTGRQINPPHSSGGGNTPKPSTHTQTFSPTDSGTQTGGGGNYWTREAWCGDTTVGGYFFGTKIANTIPNGATIVSGFVHLVIAGADFGDPPTIGTHNLGSKSGSLSASNVITISAGSGNKPLNSTILNALKNGTAKGLATDHGGQHIYGSSPGSGAVTITWKT